MKLNELTKVIENTQNVLQYNALQTVNQLLVVRNWLIGYHIVEYEQNGEDRARYGTKLLNNLAVELKKRKIKGMSASSLYNYSLFYRTYPQLAKLINEKFNEVTKIFLTKLEQQNNNTILQPSAGELYLHTIEEKIVVQLNKDIEKYITNAHDLLQHFSFRHFTALITINEPLKRIFYEQQTIKGNWSARQLERQIETLFYERLGMSINKTEMLEQLPISDFKELVQQTIKDPYIFEFTGLKELPKYSEHNLETALLDKIEDFLLELGHGFCFEARQKRITVDGEHDRIDLVFYHRILRCHVLIDLKIKKFRKEYVGQMLYYLNYYRQNMMNEYDNPPVGIILCTDRKNTQVKYATTGLDNQIFVSKYKIELPKEEDFIKLLNF